MAKSKPTPRTSPAEAPPAPPAGGDDIRPAEGFAPEGAGEPEPTGDPRDAELAALRARVAELEARPAAAYSGRYRVSLEGGPTAVVECREGEHPFDAYRRVTGVINSIHAPEVAKARADAPLGVVRPGN